MIRRHTSDVGDDHEQKTLEGAKKIMFGLIVTAIVLWVGPIALGLEADTGTTSQTGACTGQNIDMVACMEETETNVGRVMNSVLDIFKYILLAGAIGSIVFLRIRPPCTIRATAWIEYFSDTRPRGPITRGPVIPHLGGLSVRTPQQQVYPGCHSSGAWVCSTIPCASRHCRAFVRDTFCCTISCTAIILSSSSAFFKRSLAKVISPWS